MTYQNTQSVPAENLGESRNPLTFGDFQTQICGAMSMGLLQSQSEVAKTGAKMAVEFTKEQKSSYVGQSEFLQGAYKSSLHAAHKQAKQMRIGAAGEFVSAGIGVVGVVTQIREGGYGDTSKKMNVASDKLDQQERMLELAHKGSRATSGAVQATPPNPASTDPVVKARQDELISKGGGEARVLSADEEQAYQQDEYNRNDKKYYNKNASDADVSKGIATKGAFYIKGLDDKAIEGMSPDQRTRFIDKLSAEIKTTRGEISGLRSDMQRHSQIIGEAIQVGQSTARGGFQLWQSYPTVHQKEAEASAQLSNNSAGIAGGIAQNANSAKEGALSTAQNAMQSFGRVYDNMRG